MHAHMCIANIQTTANERTTATQQRIAHVYLLDKSIMAKCVCACEYVYLPDRLTCDDSRRLELERLADVVGVGGGG